MKICVIGTRGFPCVEGGVEKHCELLYPLIAAEEDTQVIVFRRKPYVTAMPEGFSGVQFVDLPSTKIKGLEAVLHSFLATVKAISLKADVVHIHNIGPALFAPLLRLFSIPVVLTYHSANYEHKKWGFFAKMLLRLCEQIGLRCAEKVIFVNRFQMEKYPKHLQDKAVYIPNGITQPVKNTGREFLDKLGVEPGKYILSVGRITPEKGFDTLIKAFAKAKPEDISLVIAGGVEFESGYMQHLQKLSRDLPVIFTGYVYGDALAQLYTNAALFALASHNEGFPLVLLEAMSYELDIAVSDIPATHLVNLEAGDYFPPGNDDALADVLRKKLGNIHARSYDLKQYNWPEVARQTAATLHAAVEK